MTIRISRFSAPPDRIVKRRPKPPQSKGSSSPSPLPGNGARYTLELAQIVGVKRAYLKSGSPSCDRQVVTGEMLKRAGIKVVRVG